MAILQIDPVEMSSYNCTLKKTRECMLRLTCVIALQERNGPQNGLRLIQNGDDTRLR